MNRSLRAIFAIVLIAAVGPTAKSQTFAKGYDVISYKATVRLDRQKDSMWGVVTMTGRAQRQLADAVQFAYLMQIDSLKFNDLPGERFDIPDSDFTWGGYRTGYAVHTPIDSGSIFTVTTYYHGKGQTEQQGSLHWGGVSDFDTMMFAMGVGFNAPYTSTTRHWLPCYDKPDDKADSIDLTFICPDSEVVASNGLLVSNTASDGMRTMHWHISHPIASYLLTFATGPYVKQSIPNKLSKPFEVYSLRRDSARVATEMNGRVADVLHFYDSLFAPYPFEKVGYVVTPIGSMEHQTMICLDRGVLGYDPATSTTDQSTVASHELAHMWWGDWVTCKTFDDAWLNEGFARFCEALVLEHLFGHVSYVKRQRNSALDAKKSMLSLSGAPTQDNHNSNYPSETIYQKGSVVLGMLRQLLGDSVFFNAVRYYGAQHAYSTATSADLQTAFEHVSGQDLSWFWKQWVYGRGYALDTVMWSSTTNGATITFHQARLTVKGPDTTILAPYFRILVPVYFSNRSGQSVIQKLWMDSLQTSTAAANIGFEPDTVKIDPEGLMLMITVKTTQIPVSGVAETRQDGRSLVVIPNPNNRDVLTCRLMNCNEGAVSYTLIDATGRTIKTWDCRDASLTELLPARGIPSGTYRMIARLQSGDSLSTSITIQH